MQRAPYYIWAPPFIHTSAGIRVLYRLVDALNCAGEEAWVAMWPFVPDRLPENLKTPLLTSNIVRKHRKARQPPIAVYPEVVLGNPLRSSAVVRYVMNEPGLLGGPTKFPGELVFGYGAMLAKALGVTENVLFLPAISLADFSTPLSGKPRNLVLFYASKFKAVHGKEPFNLPNGALEITRDNEAEPDHATLVKLLRAADRLYLYENSALAIEAPLCGCVTIMMPNPHLGYPIGANDHGMGGIAWGDDPVEIARARRTMGQMRTEYQAAIERFNSQLLGFIEKTQSFAGCDRPTFLPGRLPDFSFSYPREAASAADRIFAKDGAFALLRKGAQVFSQRGPLIFLRILLRMMRSVVFHGVKTD